MRIIAGLGNPGKKYEGTRHNVGFDVLRELSKTMSGDRPKGRFSGETVEGTISGEKVLLLWPLTFMNLSGESLLAARDFYKVEKENLLVICDDISLPCGKLRMRSSGSAGGQKGLADCIRRLGTEELPRLRVGVGHPPEGWDVADFVLSRFNKEDGVLVATAIERAATAVSCWIEQGIAKTMSKFN